MRILASALLRDFPHGFTTRAGGASGPPFDTLNLGGSVGDEPALVEENWRRLAAETGLGFARVRQVHGARVVHLDAADAPSREADGVVSATAGVAATVSVADCVPLLLADPVSGAVAAVHAGWRGTLARAAEAGVAALVRVAGSVPGRLLAAIGPSIGPCCYVVSGDLARTFGGTFGEEVVRPGASPRLDLWESNARVLAAAGLSPARIEVLGRCTSCEPGLFFSHRRDAGRTGRHAGFVAPRRPPTSAP